MDVDLNVNVDVDVDLNADLDADVVAVVHMDDRRSVETRSASNRSADVQEHDSDYVSV